MNCVSCNNEHDENYCPNCGEKNGIKRITLASITEDIFSSINMHKGLLFNIKSLIVSPKKIVTDYIRGKRKGIFNPVSYLIFSISIYLIVLAIFKTPKEINEINNLPKSALHKAGIEVGLFIRTNLKYFWVLSIIPLAISLKLIFKKYNYLEYLVISSFIIGQATFVGVISYTFLKLPLIFDPIVFFIILWLVNEILKDPKEKILSFLLSIITLFLFIIQLFLIALTIGYFKYE